MKLNYFNNVIRELRTTINIILTEKAKTCRKEYFKGSWFNGLWTQVKGFPEEEQ